MIDLAGLQRQQSAVVDLDTFGHLMAAGAPRSGRSQLLRTLATAAAACLSCADLHLYGIDCEAGPELSKIITRAAGHPTGLVVAGDPDALAGGFGGWQADARRARRGCLTAPQTLPRAISSAPACPATASAARPGPAAPCSTTATAP